MTFILLDNGWNVMDLCCRHTACRICEHWVCGEISQDQTLAKGRNQLLGIMRCLGTVWPCSYDILGKEYHAWRCMAHLFFMLKIRPPRILSYMLDSVVAIDTKRVSLVAWVTMIVPTVHEFDSSASVLLSLWDLYLLLFECWAAAAAHL